MARELVAGGGAASGELVGEARAALAVEPFDMYGSRLVSGLQSGDHARAALTALVGGETAAGFFARPFDQAAYRSQRRRPGPCTIF